MKCIKDKEVMDYFNDELNKTRKKEIAAHLDGCKKCREKFREWQAIFSLTKDYVEKDKEDMQIPDFNMSKLITISDETVEESSFSLIRYWIKPAIAVAAVVILSLTFLFFPAKKDDLPYNDNFLVLQDNFMEATAPQINSINIAYLEEALLQEIYSDDKLRKQVLSGELQDYYDIIMDDMRYNELEDSDLELLEKELNKLKAS